MASSDLGITNRSSVQIQCKFDIDIYNATPVGETWIQGKNRKVSSIFGKTGGVDLVKVLGAVKLEDGQVAEAPP